MVERGALSLQHTKPAPEEDTSQQRYISLIQPVLLNSSSHVPQALIGSLDQEQQAKLIITDVSEGLQNLVRLLFEFITTDLTISKGDVRREEIMSLLLQLEGFNALDQSLSSAMKNFFSYGSFVDSEAQTNEQSYSYPKESDVSEPLQRQALDAGYSESIPAISLDKDCIESSASNSYLPVADIDGSQDLSSSLLLTPSQDSQMITFQKCSRCKIVRHVSYLYGDSKCDRYCCPCFECIKGFKYARCPCCMRVYSLEEKSIVRDRHKYWIGKFTSCKPPEEQVDDSP